MNNGNITKNQMDYPSYQSSMNDTNTNKNTFTDNGYQLQINNGNIIRNKYDFHSNQSDTNTNTNQYKIMDKANINQMSNVGDIGKYKFHHNKFHHKFHYNE